METILTLIGNYCFPIVCCLCMGWYVYKTNESHKSEMKEINERYNQQIESLNTQHKEENFKMVEALNNNTLALQKLSDKFEQIEK